MRLSIASNTSVYAKFRPNVTSSLLVPVSVGIIASLSRKALTTFFTVSSSKYGRNKLTLLSSASEDILLAKGVRIPKAIALPSQLQPLKGQCYAGTNWMVRADILGKRKLTRVMKESHNQLLLDGTTKYMNLHLLPPVALKNRRMFHG